MGNGPLMLLIMDGFGLREETGGNAIRAARTPNLDRLFADYPHTTLGASGMDVGLPDGQMGNSEVGHTNIGAGRVVYQELTRITKSIKDGDFYNNSVLRDAVQQCKAGGKALHLLGLLSDGGVHSHMEHLVGLLELCRREGLERVFLHGFLDGRDVSPTSGKGFVEEILTTMKNLGVGTVASLCGRYYAMDRDNRWERVEAAYNALVLGEGLLVADPVAAVAAAYEIGVTDEFFPPVCCSADGKILEEDSVIFFNFRPDRARELTRAIVDEDFSGFVRKGGRRLVHYVCMTQYDSTISGVEVAFPPQALHRTLGEVLCDYGKTQLRIAETEKYAHVTFFFNGGREEPYGGEGRILIPSPKVATYDLQPQMSAQAVTQAVIDALNSPGYDVVVLNFANCDMVGHTGVFSAAVTAVETVDDCVGKVVEAVLSLGGTVLLTADHGNADRMVAEDGSPFTAHTTNPVPLLMVGRDFALRSGILADIAPTMLELLGLPIPPEMSGKSLLVHK